MNHRMWHSISKHAKVDLGKKQKTSSFADKPKVLHDLPCTKMRLYQGKSGRDNMTYRPLKKSLQTDVSGNVS